MNNNKFLQFIKKEPVLCISFLLSVLAVIIFRPDFSSVKKSIDFRTLGILFCLMICVKSFQSRNLLDWAAQKLLSKCKSVRSLYFLLTVFIFFISMAVTNDVALLTFVPLTIIICSHSGISCLELIVLETLAANLGSCITPMGNPQNLYLYSFYNFSAAEFFSATLSIGVPSLLILCLSILLRTRKGKTEAENKTGALNCQQKESIKITADWKFFVYCADFLLCLLTVFRIVPFYISLGVTVLVMLICDFRLFAKVDWSLILTFIFLFVFTGTLSTVKGFSDFLSSSLETPLSAYIAGIAGSQVISNVPAAILLSGFTANGRELLLGVNVGGLGTLIASMASIISFKLYRNCEEGKKNGLKYFGVFSAWNFSLLAVLGVTVISINLLYMVH